VLCGSKDWGLGLCLPSRRSRPQQRRWDLAALPRLLDKTS